MKIAALRLHGMRGWPDVDLPTLNPGLNVIVGPTGCGKSTVADFLAHVLFGKAPADTSLSGDAPEGEAVVEGRGGRLRLRRYHDGTKTGRLTVASLSGEPVDRDTVAGLLGGISPSVPARLCAIRFEAAPPVDRRMAAEFAGEFQSYAGRTKVTRTGTSRKAAVLAARRDALAKELELRIAGERRASGELEQRRREVERQIREGERAANEDELRLRAVETTLAETDARLRYRRLELNTELRWNTRAPLEWEPQLAELDQEISRWRATLSEIARRDATVRAKLAQTASSDSSAATLADQRTWTAVTRQLAADLEGEVARLARASASQQCVCQDAHPRLRPIVETLARQLNRLDSLIDAQQRTAAAVQWEREAEQLVRSQTEVSRHLEQLLDRRQSLASGGSPRRHLEAVNSCVETSRTFSAADADQLEQRRLALEQDRFALVERLRQHKRTIREARAERDEIDRQRAALLSARSIEHVQRELASVQRKLERATLGGSPAPDGRTELDDPCRASDFLAQLTNGRLVRIELHDGNGQVSIVRANGDSVPLEALTEMERDQVCLGFSLALVTAVSRHGVQLPLLLDDPFVRLDDRGLAALASVLDDIGRRGQQLLVFTGEKRAADRFASLGAAIHSLVDLRHWPADRTLIGERPPVDAENGPSRPGKPKLRSGKSRIARAKPGRASKTSNRSRAKTNRSDAA